MSKLGEMTLNVVRSFGRPNPGLSSDAWDLREDETFLHSSYYESGPGEVDVDADWDEVIDTPGVVDLAGTLIGYANGAVGKADAVKAIQQATSAAPGQPSN